MQGAGGLGTAGKATIAEYAGKAFPVYGVIGNTCGTPSQEEALLLSMNFVCDSAYDFLFERKRFL